MKCEHCGALCQEGAKFCTSCGKSLIQQQANQLDQVVQTEPQKNTVAQSVQNEVPKTTKGNKKIIIFIILGILIIGLGTLGVIKLLSNKNENNNEAKKEEQKEESQTDVSYIVVENDDKYGVVDSNGKIIVPIEYENTFELNDGYFYGIKRTTNEDGETNTVEGIFDINNKLTLNVEYNAYYNSKDKIWLIDDKMYDKDIKQLSDDNIEVDSDYTFKSTDGQYIGVVNTKGKEIYKESTATISSVYADKVDDDISSNLVIITKTLIDTNEEQDAIINSETGEVLYDFVKAEIYDSSYLLKVIFKDSSDVERLLIINDKIAYQTKNNIYANYDGTYDYYTITDYSISYGEEGHYKYFSGQTGEQITEIPTTPVNEDEIDTAYDYLGINRNYCPNGQYSFIKSDGTNLTDCIYDSYKFFDLSTYQTYENMKYVIGYKENSVVLIDATTGKEEKEFVVDEIYGIGETPYIYYRPTNDKLVIYNLVNQKALSISSSSSYKIVNNFVVVTDENSVKYYNENLKLIYESKSSK